MDDAVRRDFEPRDEPLPRRLWPFAGRARERVVFVGRGSRMRGRRRATPTTRMDPCARRCTARLHAAPGSPSDSRERGPRRTPRAGRSARGSTRRTLASSGDVPTCGIGLEAWVRDSVHDLGRPSGAPPPSGRRNGRERRARRPIARADAVGRAAERTRSLIGSPREFDRRSGPRESSARRRAARPSSARRSGSR